ncbi:putative integral membrane protein [Theileria parva strain Muguga]|uniref:Uncharacterized protein n=1 Tax=Theileria parva TaxID=5875 RepID=Q4MZN5_THEPA|nr:putative integral membrane protein [Theileria parva strain Muguga]EAN31226.1 putative integral membrane protein [Theileria parva strain Muguga]|eukprot:XP_763509.1 hypothetical protein [Theileria parva strain Muguga]
MAAELQYKAETKNGKPVLYNRITPESEWDDITHTRHNLDNLEFYDLNIKLTKVSQCSTELSGLIFRIFLNFLCYHLENGDKLLWNYRADPFHRIPFQLFNLKRNTMRLVFKENTMENLSMVGYVNDWVKPGKILQKTINGNKTIAIGDQRTINNLNHWLLTCFPVSKPSQLIPDVKSTQLPSHNTLMLITILNILLLITIHNTLMLITIHNIL